MTRNYEIPNSEKCINSFCGEKQLLAGLENALMMTMGAVGPWLLVLWTISVSYAWNSIYGLDRLKAKLSFANDVLIHVKSRNVFAGAIAASILATSNPAHAGFFLSAEQTIINQIAKSQRPISALYDQLSPREVPNAIGVYSKTQVLKGGKEDSNVVLNNLEVYIKPMQKKMEEASKKIHLSDAEAQKRLELLPLLMKGHILELQQAIVSQEASSQAKEVEEVQETLNEFLQLVGKQYEVGQFQPLRPATDKDLFGPLGCEFWGKKRAEGSNACVETQ
jgi:hypothetical protein